MSPLTAIAFLLCTSSVISGLPRLNKNRVIVFFSPLPALFAVMIGSSVLLSYTAGVPVLYDGKTVPMAFITAFCFILLGTGILFSTARGTWLIPSDEENYRTPLFSRWPLFIFIAAIFAIAVSGAIFIKKMVKEARANVTDELQTISNLKADQIEGWLKERMGDANVIFNSSAIQSHIIKFLEKASEQESVNNLLEWMEVLKKASGYHQIILCDRSGTARLWTSSADKITPEKSSEQGFRDALLNKKIEVNDLHTHKNERNNEQLIFMDILIPIGLGEKKDKNVTGVLILRIDPYSFLYPLIQSWPAQSKTAETLLVKKEGDKILFLNELRHLKNTALQLKMPMRPDLPATMAVMGQKGIVEGLDYREQRVVASLTGIRNSNWFMVAKVDHNEIFAPLAAKAWGGIGLVMGLIICVLLGYLILEKQKGIDYLKNSLEREQERKKMQDALIESEEHFRNIFNQAAVGICHADLNGRFIKVNSRMCDICGYSEEELLGMTFHKITHPDDLAADLAKAEKLLNGEIKTFSMIKRYIRKNGEIIWINLTASMDRFQDGRPKNFIGVIEDITERKLAEDAVLTEKERLHVTLRSIGDGVITTDTDSKITLMNKIAEDLTGWTLQDAIGKHLDEVFCIFSSSDRKACSSPATKVIMTGEIIELENNTILLNRNGTERIIEDSAAPIRDRFSQIIGVVIVFRDMTEKHKTEEALQNAQRLESLSILAGGIAHDFNNLLGGIFGYLDMALEFISDEDFKGAHSTVSGALSVFERARDLTRQLLTFSKGGAPLRETQAIPDLVKDSVAFALTGSNVSMSFEIPEGIWLSYFDKYQIGQVIDNITINARQAMPKGGKIVVSISNIPSKNAPPTRKQKDYIKISITDNGPGIPKEIIHHIFDPFFTTKQFGNGLGLATCYSIIKRHDGFIDVETETDKGTTFSIYLPASSGQMDIIKDEATKKTTESAKRILVMDDELSLLQVIPAMLERLGYTTVTAPDGDKAIEMIKKAVNENQPFSVAILDLTIPGGKGGKDIARELKIIAPGIRLIASSGYSGDSVMSEPTEFGFDSCVSKPFRLKELSSILSGLEA